MDLQWAAEKLDEFVRATNSAGQLDRVGRVVAGDESAMLDLETDMDEVDDEIRVLEPVVQIIIEAIDPGASPYERPEAAAEANHWNVRWEPAKQAALRALGLARQGAEAKERMKPDAPDLSAQQLHEWVWSAARPMWEAGSRAAAVHHAAQSVNARLQQKLGRADISEGDLCTQAFITDAPQPGRPRLRFDGDRTSKTWISLQGGAAAYGRGCFMAIRNPIAHEPDLPLSQQEALEGLAAFSRLARWIEACSVEAAPLAEGA